LTRNGKLIPVVDKTIQIVESIGYKLSELNYRTTHYGLGKYAYNHRADYHGQQEEKKDGLYSVRFKGNMIAFVNALWTGFELIDKEILADDRFIAHVKMRGENSFQDLLKVLLGEVKIEAAWEVVPSMQDVFIDLVQPKVEEGHEE